MLDIQSLRTKTTTGTDMEQSVNFETLFLYVNQLKADGARFITITASDMGDQFQLIYHFELDGKVSNLFFMNDKDKPVPSITGLYKVAFIAENEVQDLFGQKFIALNIDLGGKMLKIGPDVGTNMLKTTGGPQPTITRFYGRCREECPAMVNIPKYLRQIADGDPEGAYNTVIERAPIPAVLGRVCFAPCQTGCRQEVEVKPIQIRMLKRYASDTFKEQNGSLVRNVKRREPTGRKIAVVGGGPAGVTAAHYLGMQGHSVTLFEKKKFCGGATLWGIPKYRLPKDILEEEIQARLTEAGVELRTEAPVENVDALIDDGYEAVYLAIGSEKPNTLRCLGEDSPGVIDFMDFLTAVNVRNETPDIGDNVIIIGGGNSAMDSARVAKRLGASNITVYYRRTEGEMPALLHEIHATVKEGIDFEFLSNQMQITPEKGLEIEFQCMIPGEPDASGRRRPVPVEGQTYMREADTIISAIGTGVLVPAGFGVEVDRRGRIVVDDEYRTSRNGVWAGGDAVQGASKVIDVIRDARKAANSIDRFLGGDGLPEATIDMTEFVSKPVNLDEILKLPITQIHELPVNDRVKSFDEVEVLFTEEEALVEASRCWRCDWNE